MLGAGSAKKASRSAETAQIGFLDRALGEFSNQRDQDRVAYAPFTEGGSAGLSSLLDLLGINGPEAQQRAMGIVQSSPALASVIRNGEESVLQNASATGGLRGGDTQRGLADFRSDAFAQELERQIGRLGGISNMGLQAVGGASGAGQNSTRSIADILGQQGQVRAGGILTRGGISSSMWNNGGAFLDDAVNKVLSMFTGGGGLPAGGF
jgi:hypothetical protein